jgi:hypothetical protein
MSMVRYEGKANAQGKAAEYEVLSNDGASLTAWYPAIEPGAESMEFVATSNQYGPGNKSNTYYACPNGAGYFGILVTCKNACKKHATMAGCNFGVKCHFYHGNPGDIMTNLPLRQPSNMGAIDAQVGNSSKFSYLTAWRSEDQHAIENIDAAHIKKLTEKHETAEEQRKAREKRVEAHNQIMAKLQTGEGNQPARKKGRFAAPVPVCPPVMAMDLQSPMFEYSPAPGSPASSAPSPTFSEPSQAESEVVPVDVNEMDPAVADRLIEEISDADRQEVCLAVMRSMPTTTQ